MLGIVKGDWGTLKSITFNLLIQISDKLQTKIENLIKSSNSKYIDFGDEDKEDWTQP